MFFCITCVTWLPLNLIWGVHKHGPVCIYCQPDTDCLKGYDPPGKK